MTYFLIFYPIFLLSLSIHEAAHAYVANRLGDPTARLLGRISLNPLVHMDIVGTLILPLFGIFSGIPVLGWGKPVPVNPMNFKDMRKGNLWVALFGPLSNIFLAVLFAGIARWLAQLDASQLSPSTLNWLGIIYQMSTMGIMLNLALAVFNMIPLYPLDGYSVLRGILPRTALPSYDRVMQQGAFMLLFLFVSGALKYVMVPVTYLMRILLNG